MTIVVEYMHTPTLHKLLSWKPKRSSFITNPSSFIKKKVVLSLTLVPITPTKKLTNRSNRKVLRNNYLGEQTDHDSKYIKNASQQNIIERLKNNSKRKLNEIEIKGF